MTLELTADELSIYDEIGRAAASLWEFSKDIKGLNTDPKMFSIVLFKRLWSNHRGFTLLWNNSLFREGDIILRSGLEAAICIGANYVLREAFISLLRGDAAFSVQSDIKLNSQNLEKEAVMEGEETLKMLLDGLPEGSKAAKLDWKSLAEQGHLSQLYGFYRALSSRSSHVTGLSILPDMQDVSANDEKHNELRQLTKKMHFLMMAGATLQGTHIHAQMIEQEIHINRANQLIEQMNVLSQNWPGVTAGD
jgi:hypothetical protein